MSANVIRMPARDTAEARRSRTIADMRHSLHALGLELQRIDTLGNGDAATALQNWAHRTQSQVSRAETLAEEFAELRDAESNTDE